VQVPVERAPVQLEAAHVRERLVADDVDHGAHDAFPVPGHSAHQTF
jgi:hypothetical protein